MRRAGEFRFSSVLSHSRAAASGVADPFAGDVAAAARGRSIPTGEETSVPALDAKLGGRAFDDGFALRDAHAFFFIAGNGRLITIEFVEGYPYAQVFAPRDKDYIAIEPMTAPTNALLSGGGLRLVEPGDKFRATFRVKVQEML